MIKNAFYFPHFSNARHDRKLKRVIKELGVEGYGIYFMLLEVLREQQDYRYPLKDIDLLADEFNTSLAKLETVIKNYELFVLDDEKNFFSIKQIYYLQPYIEKTERAREAANIRWNKVTKEEIEDKSNANAMQMHNKCNADAMQIKEKKVKEIEVKENKEEEIKIEEIKEEKYIIPFQEIINRLNQKAGTNYKHTTEKTKSLIKARFNEKFTLDDFFKCIDNMCNAWLQDEKMVQYLRPETLFGNKFESYVNLKQSIKKESTSERLLREMKNNPKEMEVINEI